MKKENLERTLKVSLLGIGLIAAIGIGINFNSMKRVNPIMISKNSFKSSELVLDYFGHRFDISGGGCYRINKIEEIEAKRGKGTLDYGIPNIGLKKDAFSILNPDFNESKGLQFQEYYKIPSSFTSISCYK